MPHSRSPLRPFAAALAALPLLLVASPATAFTLAFSSSDFGLNPTFSNVVDFTFEIEVAGPLAPGVYANPTLIGVEYQVNGSLAMGTPSGFPAFFLVRDIGGAEFYAQGSSLQFEISALADLSDGLQVSELVGGTGVFVFDGHETGTGRYHPALFELNADGTGLIRNSDNTGGINPGNGQMVDVEIGDEYVTELSFDASTLTLVPEPGLLSLVAISLAAIRRR
ncbi:MAG: hypothetical protein HKP30_05120 [Myxococcales bacterium]|nr:hypothetical protein [Myxococcales bacterium]